MEERNDKLTVLLCVQFGGVVLAPFVQELSNRGWIPFEAVDNSFWKQFESNVSREEVKRQTEEDVKAAAFEADFGDTHCACVISYESPITFTVDPFPNP